MSSNDTAMNADRYRVNEIFCSLQGEGYHTGTAAVFVRLSGCNLRCPFCDTRHETGTMMTADEITAAVTAHTPRTVILTGGEPSLWPLEPLADALHAAGCRIHIETNGTRPLPPTIDWVTCSPKEGGYVVLRDVDELKIVYLGQDVEALRRQIGARNLFLQPCSGRNTAEVIGYILEHPHWRLSLQTHLITGIR